MWDVLSSVVLLYSFFLTLFTLAFEVDDMVLNVGTEIILDIFQLTEIILMCVTTRSDADGIEIDTWTAISYAYITDTFIFDIAGCMPGLIMLETMHSLYFLKLLRIIQINRTIE